jgi:hypothetical protein
MQARHEVVFGEIIGEKKGFVRNVLLDVAIDFVGIHVFESMDDVCIEELIVLFGCIFETDAVFAFGVLRLCEADVKFSVEDVGESSMADVVCLLRNVLLLGGFNVQVVQFPSG